MMQDSPCDDDPPGSGKFSGKTLCCCICIRFFNVLKLQVCYAPFFFYFRTALSKLSYFFPMTPQTSTLSATARKHDLPHAQKNNKKPNCKEE